MLLVEYAGQYRRNAQKLLKEKVISQPLIEQSIRLFRKNPEDTRLANHALKRRLSGRWAFSITDDIRVIYEWRGKKLVRFLAIGTHETVYKRNKT